MKYLFINSVAGCGSTGRIAANQCRELKAVGHECVLAYGRRAYGCDDINTVRIGNNIDNYVHVAITRLFDIHGFGFASFFSTKKFLQWVDEYNPDVVWLHNVHGYYINLGLLFDWIKKHPEKEYHWTLHDCWAFTGHCSHFTMIRCEQWKKGCSNCPQKKSYPLCIGISRSASNWEIKKRTFTGINNMTIRTPSKWLADLVGESFLKYKVEIVHNTIDTKVFHPIVSNFKEKHGIIGKKMVLAIANYWNKEKGLNDVVELSEMLDDTCALVIVGLKRNQIDRFRIRNKLCNIRNDSMSIYINKKCKVYNKINNENVGKVIKDSKSKIEHAIKNSRVVERKTGALYEAIFKRKYKPDKHENLFALILIERTESVKDLVKIYNSADFFINPTYEDNYPTVNMEAIACGIPVISYDTGGCKETIHMPNL